MKDWIKINRTADKKRILHEREYVKQMQAQMVYPCSFSYPIVLQFEVTGACNLRCRHCYNRSGDEDRVKETLMTPDKWIQLSRQIVTDGGIFQCIISGGEPLLLGDALFKIMDILHEDGTSFVVISNGFLLDKKKVERFLKYRFYWFQISIDGSNEWEHDSFRGVKGSFERAVNAALEISQHGIPLVIAHSLTSRTLPQLEKMTQLAIRLGAGTMIAGDITPSGRAINDKDIILSPKERLQMYEKIIELNNKYRGQILIERAMDVRSGLERASGLPNNGGIIRPNGDFRMDCMLPFTIGNVLENNIKDIWVEKGIEAWNTPFVQEYIKSVDTVSQMGSHINHIEPDIRL